MPTLMLRLRAGGAALLLFLLTGCYADNEERLYGAAAPCNTPVVTYRAVVAPLIQQHCLACHGTGSYASFGGNLLLEGHDKLRPVAASGLLLKSVRHQPGAVPMPQGSPQLNACQLEVLQRWVDEGLLNN